MLCVTCVHLRKATDESNGAETCLAFPEGIPRDVFYAPFDHRHPHPGDHGIRYEQSLEGNELFGPIQGFHPDEWLSLPAGEELVELKQ